jgi:hypothetical protein
MSSRRASLLAVFLLPPLFLSCVAILPFDELSDGPLRPQGHLRLDETSGGIAYDAFTLHPGVIGTELKAPLWAPGRGRRGGGLEFPDADGWLRFASLSSGPRSRFPLRATLAFWLKTRSFGRVEDELATLFYAEDPRDPSNEFDDATPMALFMAESEIVFELAGTDEIAIETSGVPLDRWVLFGVGWDIPGDTAFLYVRPEGEPAHAIVRGKLPPGFSVESADFNVSGSRGMLDDIRYYDRMLTEKDLSEVE